MRRTITIAALALALPLAACSDGGPVGPVDDLGIEGISESEIAAAGDLGDLSDADRKRVRGILREAREALRALRERVRSGELDLETAREEARALHEETLDALSEILTDDQIDRLRQRLRRGPSTGPPGERPDLDLTDEQRAAIDALHEEMRALLAAVRAAVRAGEITAEEGRARIRTRAVELRAAVCAILTGEQRAEVRFCAP